MSNPYISEIVRQINLARTDPLSFIPDVSSGKFTPSDKAETIAFLRTQKPMNTLVNDPYLNTQSQLWVDEQSAVDSTGHGNFSARAAYIEKNIGKFRSISENLAYGITRTPGGIPPPHTFSVQAYQGCLTSSSTGKTTCSTAPVILWSTPRDIIVEWIVDPGIPDRGHRLNIYKPNTQIGVGYGPHPTYRWEVANMYALDFKPI